MIRQEHESDEEAENNQEQEIALFVPRRSERIAAINDAERDRERQKELERRNRMASPEPEHRFCWKNHKGFGCAAMSASHQPQTYNAMKPVIIIKLKKNNYLKIYDFIHQVFLAWKQKEYTENMQILPRATPPK